MDDGLRPIRSVSGHFVGGYIKCYASMLSYTPIAPTRRQMWALAIMGAMFLFGGFFVTATLNSHL
jgi:hypothetical protein